MSPDRYKDYKQRDSGWLCLRCGAFAGVVDLHNAWHSEIDYARQTPEAQADLKALWERVAAEIRSM